MKKIIVIFLIMFFSICFLNNSYAKGMGIKLGYASMIDEYDDEGVDNTWSLGVLFDMGTFLFKSLRFRPSIDYLELENNYDVDVYAVHTDWYWFFMQNSDPVAPFLGFGTALNYYKIEDSDDDSDAGIEGFAGIEYDLSGNPLTLQGELRFLIHDIADRGRAILKFNISAIYDF